MTDRDVTKAKLPTWSPEDPAQWFRIAESAFEMYPGATEVDKFGTALGVVPERIYTRHAAAYEGSSTKWTALKNSVTGASTRSPQQLYTQLLELSLTGPPSDMVREAVTICKRVPGLKGKPQTLAGFQGWLVKNVVESKLPAQIRSHLAATPLDADNLGAYVDAADQLWGSDLAAQRKVTVSAVEHQVSAVNTVGARGAPAKPGAKGSGSSKGGSGNRANNRLIDGKCRIHARYGADAYTCANPSACSMKAVLKKKKVAEVTATPEDD